MVFVPIYILILFFTIIIDYFAGILIEKSKGKKRKLFLTFSLIANIGILAVFKYYNFFAQNFNILLTDIGANSLIPYLSILLPIGLSFHTFQAMSYTIEVYRGNQKAERHFGIYSLYVMFYPQLVAGPIERPQNLIHQFFEEHKFEYQRVIEGLRLMLVGFFYKLVVADRLAIYVNSVYQNHEHHNGTTLLIASIFFTFQIYCDFAGYSSIAIGVAKILGFNLMTNFKRPFFAKSIDEFWKRWHISLSTWFKDYLYISMGGNRVSISKRYFNLFFVFLVSGLWHGANWTYVIWGIINGFYLVFALITKTYKEGFYNFIKINRFSSFINFNKVVTTFLLSTFAFIFFRAPDINTALNIIEKIFTSTGKPFYDDISILVYSVVSILLLVVFEFNIEKSGNTNFYFRRDKLFIRHLSYAVIILIILMLGVFDGGEFIYFQF